MILRIFGVKVIHPFDILIGLYMYPNVTDS